jgi:transposase
VDREQQFLLPQNMMDWLPRDHFARFVIELVDVLDTSSFLAAYRADGRGRRGVPPEMMAVLLMYAYCDGERSSRRIEERCQTDIAYRYITGGREPDHCTIARFHDRHGYSGSARSRRVCAAAGDAFRHRAGRAVAASR